MSCWHDSIQYIDTEHLGCEKNQGHQDERKRPQWMVQSWQKGAEVRDQEYLLLGSLSFAVILVCCQACLL